MLSYGAVHFPITVIRRKLTNYSLTTSLFFFYTVYTNMPFNKTGNKKKNVKTKVNHVNF